MPFDFCNVPVIGQRLVTLLRQPIEVDLDRIERIGEARTVHQQRPLAGEAHAKTFDRHHVIS
jgi:hypothetical protein